MSLKICPKGHRFNKTSDCPTCPICENERKPKDGILSILSAPARLALENKGIKTLKQLSAFREEEILSLHGIGPASLPKLGNLLQREGLSFKS